jgi:hypothetical protein
MCQLYKISDNDKAVATRGFKEGPGQPDFKYGAVKTPDECQDLCTDDPNCMGWIHYNNKAEETLQGTCSLIAYKKDGAKDFRGFK